MSALPLRLPDDKHVRLRALTQSRGTSVNRLLDEATTLLLAEFDAETRFRLRAQQGAGRIDRGLELLDKAAESSPLLTACESGVPLAGAACS
ncbi:MAG: toxin-antitoxin system HicB family antitoxin [Pseudomonadota bacterium]